LSVIWQGLLIGVLLCVVTFLLTEARRPERPEASDLSNILDDDTNTSRDRASFVGALVSPLKEEEEDPSLSATPATSASSASSSTLELPPTLVELDEKSSTGEVEELPVMYKNRRKLCKVKAKDMVDGRSLVQGRYVRRPGPFHVNEMCTKDAGNVYERFTKGVRTVYELCTNCVRTVYELCTNCVRSEVCTKGALCHKPRETPDSHITRVLLVGQSLVVDPV
jgi:cbb3-type cytochrome oxidase subunit 3